MTKQKSVSRREFFRSSAAVSVIASAASKSRILGANDRIRLGAIGTGGRSRALMVNANKISGIEWVAVCDAWERRCAEGAERTGVTVDKYQDYRKLLDRSDIDGVFIATWDNTHAQISIDSCRSGKDVYVEKPMTNRPEEGPEMVRAVEEYGRVLQVGVQQRGGDHFKEAKQKFFDSGLIGDVHMVRTVWNANRGYLNKPPAGMERKPDDLDWEACLGPLPKIPWDPKRYFNRFAYWDLCCGGQSGGLFVHLVDVVHWFLDLDRPVSAVALGGIYQYDDGRDTPDNVNFIVDYPRKLNVTFEATITDLIREESADIVFFGSGGRLSIFRGGYTFLPAEQNENIGEVKEEGDPLSVQHHIEDWLESMRNRKQPSASVVTGHYSAMPCHLGNLAYLEKRRVTWREEWNV